MDYTLPTKFPKNFLFGTATAAYQIEGATNENGRGVSVWDAIRREEGRIKDGSSISQSCESFKKYKEDIELLKNLGVTAYRFSICWSRILPNGTLSTINEEGIAYYLDLCERLVANNMKPIVTLFHADMPLTIYDSGTWLNKRNCEHFANFANLCFQKFGHLVKTWITFNEINMQAWAGVAKYEGCPWHSPDRPDPENKESVAYRAAHNMILTHAKIYGIYQEKYKKEQNGHIGLIIGGRFCYPATKSINDIEASQRGNDCLVSNTIEPILGNNGSYPESIKKFYPEFTENEKELIKGSIDFLGINYYLSHLVRDNKERGNVQYESDGRICGEQWVRYIPQGLHDLLKYIKLKYGNIPVMITENGCMDVDGSDPLRDAHRIKYIEGHISAVSKAIRDGCNVTGYIAWSLMDNFEWDDGFAIRFGLYRVEFENDQKTRIMKDSAKFYKNFIARYKEHHKLTH
ncbi:unnamed protein product [Caenorhabditis bovis]|uniref:Uncharacterized protein n=1 Tax=Caenorhabditis bovis TaxID=2654633 RepID=A0A8S1F9T8_9PELO|nr:unnamed protein product [Caenorhabditis bovis]